MICKLFVPIVIVFAMTGCATKNYDPYQDIRFTSIDLAKMYTKDLREFLDINGVEKTLAEAQNAVRGYLKDPDSAKFQNMRIVDFNGGKAVCGNMNGKNSYGGYVGFKSFVAGTMGAKIYDTSSPYPAINDASNGGIFAACGY